MSKGWTRLFCHLLPTLAICLLLAACGGGDEDETAPKLKLTDVGDPASTTVRSHTLGGTVEVGALLTVTVDTEPTAKVINLDDDTSDGAWSCTISDLAPGPNVVSIQAEDERGNLTSITVNLLYDALSIETWVSPIPGDTLTIGGLVGQFDTPPTSFTATVNTAATATDPVVSDDRWSSDLSGLVDGDNIVTLTLTHQDLTAPVEKTVTINVNASAPVVTIDPPVAPFAADMTVAGDRSSGVAVVVAAPTATVGTVDLATDPVRWSCPLTGLDRGKNAITASATASGVTAIAHELIVLP